MIFFQMNKEDRDYENLREDIQSLRDKIYDNNGILKSIEQNMDTLYKDIEDNESAIEANRESIRQNSKYIWIGIGGVSLLTTISYVVSNFLTV